MTPLTNHSISVDCVVFGFDGTSLKVLLVGRNIEHESLALKDFKLPGSLILEHEDLTTSAYRVLEQMTGIKDIYLRQLHVFSDPKRVEGSELDWLNKFYGVNTTRVVTVAYYSLLKLNSNILKYTQSKGAIWADVQEIKQLALDHKSILVQALSTLNSQLHQSPVAFELLPKKFTIRQLQNLYSAILGIEIDNRNFRKKILTSGYITPTKEREKGVAHKPALFYTFNKVAYKKSVQNRLHKTYFT